MSTECNYTVQLKDNGNIVNTGGRVLCICALGDSVSEAQKQAYQLVDQVNWQDAFYRTDIGYRAVKRES